MSVHKTSLFKDAALAISISVLLVLLAQIPSLAAFEKKFLDLSFKIRGSQEAHSDIVIAAVTDDSLKRIGVWPWPRRFHATLLNILKRAQPRAVVFDMIFAEKSQPQDDELLAQAITSASNVILSYYFSADSADEMQGKTPDGLPIESFLKPSKGIGYTNIFPDRDGHIRELVIQTRKEDTVYDHISLAALRFFTNGQITSKLPNNPHLIINFPGPFQKFRVIPFEYLVAMSQYKGSKTFFDSLKGKLILVGHTATGTAMDLKPTAFSNAYPGVGVIASAIHTLLTEKWIRPLPPLIHGLALALFSFLVMILTKRNPPMRGLIYNLSALIILFEVTQLLFQFAGIWFPFGSFLAAAAGFYAVLTLLSLIQITFEREVMSRELSLASRIQKNLLPTEIPVIPGLEIAALTLPARHVGGDLYDLIELPSGQCGVCIGDVSGKGVPAALFMARSLSEFRREANSLNPSEVITNLNKKLSEGGFTGLFVTLLYLVINPAGKKIVFANGGHEPILHYRKSTNQVELLKTDSGGPVGIEADTVFDQKDACVEPGDFLLLESDGVKEAMNMKKEIFGFERLQAAMIEAAALPIQDIMTHVKKRVDEFVGAAPQHDDLTIVIAKFV